MCSWGTAGGRERAESRALELAREGWGGWGRNGGVSCVIRYEREEQIFSCPMEHEVCKDAPDQTRGLIRFLLVCVEQLN